MSLGHGPKVVTDGLVLYLDAANPRSYPGSGTTWKDLSGNGNDGSLVNGVGYSSDNKGTMTFDGTNDYISGSKFNYDDGLGKFTVSAWVKPSTFINSVTYNSVINRTDNNHIFSLFFASDLYNSVSETVIGAMASWIFNTSGQIQQHSSLNLVPTLNEWNYCTWQWEDNVGYTYLLYTPTSYQIYTHSTNHIIRKDSTSLFTIGRWFGGNYYLDGEISLVNVYDKKLSESEIKQNFNATRSRYGI